MNRSATKPLHVLVLGTPARCDELTGWINEHAHVKHVESFDKALESLGTEQFDVIVSDTVEFIPFQYIHSTGQAAVLLEGLDQGVGIIDESGKLVFANARLHGMSEKAQEQVCLRCVETMEWARTAKEFKESQTRRRRFSVEIEGCHLEITATPIIDLHHRVIQVAAVVWDSSRSRRLESKIDAIDRAGRELVSLDIGQVSQLDTEGRLALLEKKILGFVEGFLHFDNFEIFVLDKASNTLDLVFASGESMEGPKPELFVSTEGNGVCGFVAGGGRSYICPDVTADKRYITGIESARSSLTVPLKLHDRVVGVANFESTKLAAFHEDDRQIAEIFAGYVAMALHVLELLVTERQTTTGKLGTDVMSEITGPLSDILTETEQLIEDYIGHDDLRYRLRSISANAVGVRDTIRQIASGKCDVRGARGHAAAKNDPLLAGKRILVADDEDMIRDTVRDVLARYGAIVSTADDGALAISLVQNEPYDLVISDIKMPLNNGYEVFAAAKDTNSALPVILTTGFGYDPNHSIVRARREGLAAVLFKPFKVDQLLNEVRMALQPGDQS